VYKAYANNIHPILSQKIFGKQNCKPGTQYLNKLFLIWSYKDKFLSARSDISWIWCENLCLTKRIPLRKKKVWETKPQAKILKNLLNCFDYGHILGQINPSTQTIVKHRVQSLCKQYSPNLESKNIWETKPQAKKDNISINHF